MRPCAMRRIEHGIECAMRHARQHQQQRRNPAQQLPTKSLCAVNSGWTHEPHAKPRVADKNPLNPQAVMPKKANAADRSVPNVLVTGTPVRPCCNRADIFLSLTRACVQGTGKTMLSEEVARR